MATIDSSLDTPLISLDTLKELKAEPNEFAISISYQAAASATNEYRQRVGKSHLGPLFYTINPRGVDGMEVSGDCYYDAIFNNTLGKVSIPVNGKTEIRLNDALPNPTGLEIFFKPCPPCNVFSPIVSNVEFIKAFK